jgi:hypothetical protein
VCKWAGLPEVRAPRRSGAVNGRSRPVRDASASSREAIDGENGVGAWTGHGNPNLYPLKKL